MCRENEPIKEMQTAAAAAATQEATTLRPIRPKNNKLKLAHTTVVVVAVSQKK